MCVNQIEIKTTLFFCKSSDAVKLSYFFNSLNKMTNAAYENAMRRCPRN